MSLDTKKVSKNGALVTIAVNDANLLIDLWEVGLLNLFFHLPLSFHTTQLIISELDEKQVENLAAYIEQGKLTVRHLTRAEIDDLDSLSVNSRKLSRQDLSVYFYAKELIDCMILTGDNRLRKEAERQGFEVHGILWVFEQMLENNIIDRPLASEKLQNLMKRNLWLPMAECQKCLERWNENNSLY